MDVKDNGADKTVFRGVFHFDVWMTWGTGRRQSKRIVKRMKQCDIGEQCFCRFFFRKNRDWEFFYK